jgi:hypothetical protein
MTPTDLGLLTLALFAWAVVAVLHIAGRTLHHDEMFTEVTPGVIPPRPGSAPRHRLPGLTSEYDGEVAVAFSPPKGVRPGLVGTVVDGRVDSFDLTATLVDLAVRGHLRITAVPPEGEPSVARRHYARRDAEPPRTDWILTRGDEHPYDVLDELERHLLDGLFRSRSTVRFSQLDHLALQALRETQVGLYREVVRRGWYPRHPQQRGRGGCALIAAGVVLAGLFVLVRTTWAGALAAVLVLAAAVVATRALRGRTPRTAEGSAVRIQALGFRKYLQTAEADQFRFEEAAGIFSRYLPYAMAFGVAQHWAKVFGDVARKAHLAGADPVEFDLTWFDVAAWHAVDMATDLLWWDSLDGSIDLIDTELVAQLGGDVVEGLGGFATEVGEFMGSLDFLDGRGDGCDGDGCGDAAGCLDA